MEARACVQAIMLLLPSPFDVERIGICGDDFVYFSCGIKGILSIRLVASAVGLINIA